MPRDFIRRGAQDTTPCPMPMDRSIAQESTASQTLPADGTESPPAKELRAACAPPPWGPEFAAAAAGPKPARNGQKPQGRARVWPCGALKIAAKSGQKRPRSAAHPRLIAAPAAEATFRRVWHWLRQCSAGRMSRRTPGLTSVLIAAPRHVARVASLPPRRL